MVLRKQERDASFTQSDQDISTDDVGAIGSLRWRPWTFLDVFARYENVQIDDPFVVPGDPANNPPLPERQIALTFTNRGSLGFQLAPREWVSLRYEFHADSSENDTFAHRHSSLTRSASQCLRLCPN